MSGSFQVEEGEEVASVRDVDADATNLLKDINPAGSSNPYHFTPVPAGRTAVFSADDGILHGKDLWFTDGSEEGTRMRQDIAGGPDSSNPSADWETVKPFPIAGDHVFLEAIPVECIGYSAAGDCGAPLQLPGDGNQDATLDISDGISLLNFLFGGGWARSRLPCGDGVAADPANLLLLDATSDRRLDLSDAVAVFNHLFLGGPPPALGKDCVPIAGCPSACRV